MAVFLPFVNNRRPEGKYICVVSYIDDSYSHIAKRHRLSFMLSHIIQSSILHWHNEHCKLYGNNNSYNGVKECLIVLNSYSRGGCFLKQWPTIYFIFVHLSLSPLHHKKSYVTLHEMILRPLTCSNILVLTACWLGVRFSFIGKRIQRLLE